MTKLLEEAIEKIRKLPEPDQDDAAELLRTLTARANAPVRVDQETRAAISEALAQAQHGNSISAEKIAAAFKPDRRKG